MINCQKLFLGFSKLCNAGEGVIKFVSRIRFWPRCIKRNCLKRFVQDCSTTTANNFDELYIYLVLPQGLGHHNSICSYCGPVLLNPPWPCQLSLWEKTGVPGGNPRLSTERWLEHWVQVTLGRPNWESTCGITWLGECWVDNSGLPTLAVLGETLLRDAAGICSFLSVVMFITSLVT